jgi:hypothetical protein
MPGFAARVEGWLGILLALVVRVSPTGELAWRIAGVGNDGSL